MTSIAEANGAPWPHLVGERLKPVAAALLPIAFALLAGSVLLMVFQRDPVSYFAAVLERGLLSWMGLQEVLTRMAPLLLVAAGLIFCFRAGVWNLGSDGQFLVAAACSSAAAVPISHALPMAPALALICLVGFFAGAIWSLLPALLKVRYGTNEIVTTLMMSLLGARVASFLVKGPFSDPNSTAPQTVTLPMADRFPRLFDSSITSALILGIVVVLVSHAIMTRTAFGLRLRMVGANPRATVHAGEPVGILAMLAFAIGGGMAGLAGAVEVTAIAGNLRADENPGYGLAILPLVFLARFNGPATVALTFFYALLVVGAKSAARKAGVPQEFLLVLVGLVLVFMGLMEWGKRQHAQRKLAQH